MLFPKELKEQSNTVVGKSNEMSVLII